MRCSMCGHESPTGSSFCLNCGSSLAQAVAQTQSPAPGLPGICVVCRGENPPGMKFCRSCGSALPVTSPGAPAFGTPVGRPRPGPTPSPLGAQTPVGFAYCQQCGLNMQGIAPTDPGANARPRTPSAAPPLGLRDAPID